MLTVWIIASIYFVGIFVIYHAMWRAARARGSEHSPGALEVAISTISILWPLALLLVAVELTAKAVEERGG